LSFTYELVLSAVAVVISIIAIFLTLLEYLHNRNLEQSSLIAYKLIELKEKIIKVNDEETKEFYRSIYLDLFEWYSFLSNRWIINGKRVNRYFDDTWDDGIHEFYDLLIKEKPDAYPEIRKHFKYDKIK
jgi:hypothetical protein